MEPLPALGTCPCHHTERPLLLHRPHTQEGFPEETDFKKKGGKKIPDGVIAPALSTWHWSGGQGGHQSHPSTGALLPSAGLQRNCLHTGQATPPGVCPTWPCLWRPWACQRPSPVCKSPLVDQPIVSSARTRTSCHPSWLCEELVGLQGAIDASLPQATRGPAGSACRFCSPGAHVSGVEGCSKGDTLPETGEHRTTAPKREAGHGGGGGRERLSSPARSLRALLGGADKWRLSQQGLAAIESL
jgi:hypothetical protein